MNDQNKSGIGFALSCLIGTIVFAVMLVLAGFGTHVGWWGFRRGLAVLRWSAYAEAALAAISLFVCIVSFYRKSSASLILSVVAVVIGVAAVSQPIRMWMTFRTVPMIHDITTDTENPPSFDAVLRLRKEAQNPAAYGGAEIAAEQHKAYPDIAPLFLETPADVAFERSLNTARKLGWEIVHADARQGIIEATDTTFWFRFKDDVVVRITAEGDTSRVDIRSLSRVGKSDVGTNASRIRTFFAALRKNG